MQLKEILTELAELWARLISKHFNMVLGVTNGLYLIAIGAVRENGQVDLAFILALNKEYASKYGLSEEKLKQTLKELANEWKKMGLVEYEEEILRKS